MNNLKIVRTKNAHILDPQKIPYVDRQILISIDNDKPSIYIDRVEANNNPSRLLLNGSFHIINTKSALADEEIKDAKILYLVIADPIDINNGFYRYTGNVNSPFELIDVFGKINSISVNGGSPLSIVNKHVNIPINKDTVGLDAYIQKSGTSDSNNPDDNELTGIGTLWAQLIYTIQFVEVSPKPTLEEAVTSGYYYQENTTYVQITDSLSAEDYAALDHVYSEVHNVVTGSKLLQCTGIQTENINGEDVTSFIWTELQTKIDNSNKLDSGYINDTNSNNKFVTPAEKAEISRIVTDELIPNDAAVNNKLTTEAFVNSSINNSAAYYITKNAAGNAFATHAELISTTTLYSGGQTRVPTRNDYCIVLADESQPQYIAGVASIYNQWTTTDAYIGYYVNYNSAKTEVTAQNKDNLDIVPGTTIPYTQTIPTTRYTYQGVWATNGVNGWEFQYVMNNSGLTAAQLAALNSGITAGKISEIDIALAGTVNSVLVNGASVVNNQVASIDLKTINSNNLNGSGNIDVLSGVTVNGGNAGVSVSGHVADITLPKIIFMADEPEL